MPKRTPQDWGPLEEELHAAGVTAEEIQAGARKLLAENRGISLPRLVSNSASHRKILPRRSG